MLIFVFKKMDPNAGKKNMFNKLSKEQCVSLLKKETFNRVTISFYKYIILNNLNELRDDLYKKWSKLCVLGRIYIAEEGINAQLSIPEHNLEEFSETTSDKLFDQDVNEDDEDFEIPAFLRKQKF